MNNFSKNGALLFAGAMVVFALALPSVTSASSWGLVPSHHTLDSSNLGFTQTTPFGTINILCATTSLTANVTSTQNMEITTASFGGACATQIFSSGGHCTTTMVATRLPWTATAVTTSNIQIRGMHIDARFDNTPGQPDSCTNIVGQSATITGTLTGGAWAGNAAHAINFNNIHGLFSHGTLGNNVPMTMRGQFIDTQASLVVN